MKTLITFLILVSSGVLYAQERAIPEEEVSFAILKWHYNNYPNSEDNEWVVRDVSGEAIYRVRFEYEEKNYQVDYNDQGFVLLEVQDLKDEIPVSILHGLETDNKYKIKEFLKVKDTQKELVVYKLDVKVRSEGQKIFWYDENYIKMPNTDFSTSLTDL